MVESRRRRESRARIRRVVLAVAVSGARASRSGVLKLGIGQARLLEDGIHRVADRVVVQIGIRPRGGIEPGALSSSFTRSTDEADLKVKSAAEVDQAEEDEDEHDGRNTELNGGLASLGRAPDVHYKPALKSLRTKIAAGPRRMIHKVGKMHPTMGISIFREAFAPRSSALMSRFRRISSD